LIAELLELKPSEEGPAQTQRQLEADAEAVKDWLTQCPVDWLLILDNFDHIDLEDPGLMHFIPSTKAAHIILTSRDPLSRGVGSDGIEVLNMTKGDAVDLLLKRTRKEKTPENVADAEEITSVLGDLALAVDQAGAFILARQTDLSELIHGLKNWRREMVKYKVPSSLWQYNHNVLSCWEMSFEHVSSTCKDASHLMLLFGVSSVWRSICCPRC
jgi:hypothetical protein